MEHPQVCKAFWETPSKKDIIFYIMSMIRGPPCGEVTLQAVTTDKNDKVYQYRLGIWRKVELYNQSEVSALI